MSPAVPAHPLADGRTASSPLVRALRGERPERPPVWFPAGDPLPGTTADVERIVARTMAPVDAIGVDGVDLAVDLLTPARLAGAPIHDAEAVVDDPIRTGSDVLRLRPADPARLEPIARAAAIAVDALGRTPLIASALGPFALASLLVEGEITRDQRLARTLMYADPHTWAALLNWCADVAGQSLRAQVLAGASVAELRDPHLGSLSRHDQFKRVLPHAQRALAHLRGLAVPTVMTGIGTAEHLDLLARAGAAGVGVDWRLPLDVAAERVGPDVPLLGNLDPALLAAPPRLLEAHVHDVLDRGRSASAHVLTVGGHVPAETPTAVLRAIGEIARGDR